MPTLASRNLQPFASPVILEGKLILQQLVVMGKKANNNNPLGWDDSLPENMNQRWRHWRDTLPNLENVSIPQCYHRRGFGTVERREIDASTQVRKPSESLSTCERSILEEK